MSGAHRGRPVVTGPEQTARKRTAEMLSLAELEWDAGHATFEDGVRFATAIVRLNAEQVRALSPELGGMIECAAGMAEASARMMGERK